MKAVKVLQLAFVSCIVCIPFRLVLLYCDLTLYILVLLIVYTLTDLGPHAFTVLDTMAPFSA